MIHRHDMSKEKSKAEILPEGTRNFEITACENQVSKSGNCDAYFYDIDETKGTHYLMTDFGGLNVPTRRNSKIAIGIYTDVDNLTYNDTSILCNLKDILSGRVSLCNTNA